MPGLVSLFLRLIREDRRRYRLIARRRHGVGGLRRFRRRMQAIRRFGRDAAGRGYHGTRRDARGGYYASGSGLHAAGCAHRGAPAPSAPAVHEDVAAPAPPPDLRLHHLLHRRLGWRRRRPRRPPRPPARAVALLATCPSRCGSWWTRRPHSASSLHQPAPLASSASGWGWMVRTPTPPHGNDRGTKAAMSAPPLWAPSTASPAAAPAHGLRRALASALASEQPPMPPSSSPPLPTRRGPP
ncbi:hypothetical protein ZWY2020_037593 [Hordeum vulgare]|nr:hypothetical protein ZWY2020_037593 [Hordeum vulgare]